MLNGEDECFSPNIENKAELSILFIPIQQNTGDSS